MNYYNPYYMMAPMTSVARPGLFAALRGATSGRLTLGTIVNGTQKTLGIINQAIPIVKQVTPVMKNAKTMFRVMNEFKKVDTPSQSNMASNKPNAENTGNDEQKADDKASVMADTVDDYSGPTFFA